MTTNSTAPPSTLDDALYGAAIYYLTSLVMFLGFSLGFEFFDRPRGATPREAGFLGAFATSSGRYYKQIVEKGYNFEPQTASNVSFFPVYPLVARGVAQATGLPTEAALLLVSNLSLVSAVFVLTRYLRARPRATVASSDAAPSAARYTTPPPAAQWALVAMGLFPTGCFFRMCYAESTFLLLSVTAMFGLQQLCSGSADGAPRRWLLPAVVLVIGVATATRATGVALLGPLALYIWQSQPTLAARAWRLAAWLPVACSGLVAFMAFQYVRFGDALAFVEAQVFWHTAPALDWRDKLATLATLDPLRAVYDPASRTYWGIFDRHGIPWLSLGFANPLFFVVAIALVALGARRRWLTRGETALTLLLLLIPYVTRAQEMGMLGAERFAAVAFPLYIVLGQLLSRLPSTLAAALLAISGFFLALYSALFAAGYVIL